MWKFKSPEAREGARACACMLLLGNKLSAGSRGYGYAGHVRARRGARSGARCERSESGTCGAARALHEPTDLLLALYRSPSSNPSTTYLATAATLVGVRGARTTRQEKRGCQAAGSHSTNSTPESWPAAVSAHRQSATPQPHGSTRAVDKNSKLAVPRHTHCREPRHKWHDVGFI